MKKKKNIKKLWCIHSKRYLHVRCYNHLNLGCFLEYHSLQPKLHCLHSKMVLHYKKIQVSMLSRYDANYSKITLFMFQQ